MRGGGGHCPYFLFFSQKTPGKEKTGGQRRPQLSVLFIQSCLTLCDPKDCNPTGSSVHVILQARILEWVAMPFSRGSSQPRDQTQVYCIAGIFFIKCVHAKSLESFLTLCNPMDHSPPGSSVHGILQARILEWVAIPFSRESFQPRNQIWVSCIAGRFFFFFTI